jgi:D-glycero-D-manno-heptose 1,7-bisphosphate phosphatase
MAKLTPTPEKAVFLDRDGVLNQDSGYVFRTEDLRVLPGVPQTLQSLKKAGFLLVVITNQSGVARGMFSLSDVDTFHRHLRAEIVRQGGPELDAFYTCPHHPDGTVPEFAVRCSCRKPGPELLLRAARDLRIDLPSSWMIGDKDSDAAAARAAGVQAILIQSEKYRQEDATARSVSTITEAANLITG